MEALAPWAEPVLMTADELMLLPEDGYCYELVEGRLVRMSPTSSAHGRILMKLLLAIGRFVEERHLGQVFPPETGFWISPEGAAHTVLAPDLAFFRAGREPDPETAGYPHLAPDFVVEVTSPSQTRTKMAAKARLWCDAGVRLVWVVLPEIQAVDVWHSGERTRVMTAMEELSGEDILPGLVLPVSSLFS